MRLRENIKRIFNAIILLVILNSRNHAESNYFIKSKYYLSHSINYMCRGACGCDLVNADPKKNSSINQWEIGLYRFWHRY